MMVVSEMRMGYKPHAATFGLCLPRQMHLPEINHHFIFIFFHRAATNKYFDLLVSTENAEKLYIQIACFA